MPTAYRLRTVHLESLSLGAGVHHSGLAMMPAGARVIGVQSVNATRVRLYRSEAAQQADVERPVTDLLTLERAADHGCLLDAGIEPDAAHVDGCNHTEGLTPC